MDSHFSYEFLKHTPDICAELQALLREVNFAGDHIRAVREFARRVEEATRQEFPGHNIAELGLQVRVEVHNRPGPSNIRTVETLLNQLCSRTGKIQGHRSFDNTLLLYMLLDRRYMPSESEASRLADSTLGFLMGQGTMRCEGLRSFIDMWNRMLLETGINISGWEVEQAQITAKQVSMNYALNDVVEFLDDIEGACGYVVSNILPDTSETVTLLSSEDVYALLLQQIAAWYFLPYGKPLTSNHIRHKLQSRASPYRYDRYFGHFLMQYALLETLALRSETYGWLCAPATGLHVEFATIFDEYLATTAFWRSVIDWNEYVESIISVRFLRKTPSVLNTFKRQFKSEHGLIEPEKLLHHIHAHILGLRPMSEGGGGV